MNILENISIYNISDSFELKFNSTEHIFPMYFTKELIYGRKCFDIKWLGGDCAIAFGFIKNPFAVFFYGEMGKPHVIMRKSGIPDITQSIPSIIRDVSYLTCINTKERRFDLIQGTTHLSFDYPKTFPNKMYAFNSEGANNRYDKVE